jgi:hypothetical protein
MTSQDLIDLSELEHAPVVRSQDSKKQMPWDIYLLPYTTKEVQNPDEIPKRDLNEVQLLKLHHLHEVYVKAVQLPFSALVMTHEESYSSEISEAARSGTLLPEHLEPLEGVFGNFRPTRISRRYSGSCSYGDLKDVFNIQKTFFRSEPFSGKESGDDMQYSGWSFRFEGEKGDSILIEFDPWFKTLNCNIFRTLCAHFRTRFPETLSSYAVNSTDPALESRMAAYIGIDARDYNELVQTANNLFSPDFDLHGFEHFVSAGGLNGQQHYGLIGTRKTVYQKDPSTGTKALLS